MAICSASEYKAWAGISASTYDARLAIVIPQLQAKVERYCRRAFDYSTPITEKVDGAGTDCITLSRAPIYSITSITILYNSSDSVVLTSTDYTFSAGDDGRVWLYGAQHQRAGLDPGGFPRSPAFGYEPRFPVGRGNVSVVYAGGYGTPNTAMPSDLVLAFMETLSELLLTSTAGAGGSTQGAATALLKSKTLGRASEEYRDVEQAFGKFKERFYPFRRVILGAA